MNLYKKRQLNRVFNSYRNVSSCAHINLSTSFACMCDSGSFNAYMPIMTQGKPFTTYLSEQPKNFHISPLFYVYNITEKGEVF